MLILIPRIKRTTNEAIASQIKGIEKVVLSFSMAAHSLIFSVYFVHHSRKTYKHLIKRSQNVLLKL
ncbi:hypothetical protein JCM9152_1392 [Halalkalibacter hemicellulosilyticusJCM 9152]|uniref:Uncharacterized protein n=1 Tax=Halalkalibacter hemicellulosilyticusJCM 9152 TaxID=1236971 RepID=W4QD71_9BACI|nr:hypothetical protein JCM9152_1392 [Halalkalibacter hemicellulosilyticusJCM 9152]